MPSLELLAILILAAFVLYQRRVISKQEEIIELVQVYHNAVVMFLIALKDEGVEDIDPQDMLNWGIALVESKPLEECPNYIQEVYTPGGIKKNDLFGNTLILSENRVKMWIISGIREYQSGGLRYVPKDIMYYELPDGMILRVEAVMSAGKWEVEDFKVLPHRKSAEWETISDEVAGALLHKFDLADE